MKENINNNNYGADHGNKDEVTKDIDAVTPIASVVEGQKQLQQDYYQSRLLQLKDFNDAFELVKSAVDSKFKMHRAGLGLILQVLPTQLGAYHILGSNMIIMNKRILDIIKSKKSQLDYNSYLFMVLCHEYLHSFGIMDEMRVRKMTFDLCLSLLGEGHPSSLMARYQPWEVFPELKLYQTNDFDNSYEIIKNFDKSTQSYIN
jgi:hypothetical protein